MNKNIEIQKIKVNNGQELIQKAKEYKNSGGEWKLLETYFTLPFSKKQEKGWSRKNNSRGFIISNGEQKVDIILEGFSEMNNFLCEGGWEELCQLFPELTDSRIPWEEDTNREKVHCASFKRIGDKDLYRYLVAENSWHLTQIVHQWVQENKTEIQQSSNSDFASWVEIIDGQDGNMYLYVGKKNDNGGREIKIGIKKDKYFEEVEGIEGNRKRGGDGFYNAGEDLEINWDLMLITVDFAGWPLKFKERKNDNQPVSRAIKDKILRNLDKISIEQCGHLINAELVKNYEEVEWYFRKGIFGDNNNSKWKAWWDKVQKVEIEGEEIDLEQLSGEDYRKIKEALINEIKQNPQDWKIEEKKHTHWTEKMVRHQKTGRRHWKGLSIIREWKEIEALVKGQPLSVSKISDAEKSQILQYFISKGIKKIAVNNGRLVIEYNDNTTKNIESGDQQLQKYRQLIQALPNQSLSLSELQSNNSSAPNKNNTGIYIGLAIVSFIVGGIFVCFLARKKKK